MSAKLFVFGILLLVHAGLMIKKYGGDTLALHRMPIHMLFFVQAEGLSGFWFVNFAMVTH